MGISSAIATIAVARQTGKGVAAANPTVKFKLAGAPSIGPVKNRNRYTVTDTGRDNGPTYTSGMLVQGDFPIYLEPQAMGLLGYGIAGANADTGTTPNYTHIATPANDVPYHTIWRMVGNVVIEQFVDCKFSSLRVEGSAGQALQSTVSAVGISSNFLATDTVLAATDPAGYLFPEGQGALKVDTVAQPLHNFTLEINNNLSPFQADGYTMADIDPGKREVNFSFGVRFGGAIAFPDYRAFYYGSDAGTTLSPVVTTHAIQLLFTRTANISWQLDLPVVEYLAIPVNGDPGGDPIDLAVSCSVERPTGGGNIFTLTSKDQLATA